MNTFLSCFFATAFGVAFASRLAVAQPEVAELDFTASFQTSPVGTNALPGWIQGVEQTGGQFSDQPACWQVDNSQPAGCGRLEISVDRQLMNEDLALYILYEKNDNADLAVQLFDAGNRVVALDLFANLVAVGKEAKTDTFIVPWRKYQTATKILVRRVTGDVRIYGLFLFPVVTENEGDVKTMLELARLFGDPISPDNPIMQRLTRAAKNAPRNAAASADLPAQTPGSSVGVQWKQGEKIQTGNTTLLVDASTLGYYNTSLSSILDGTQPQFPRPGLQIGYGTGADATIYPAMEPNLGKANPILGTWLSSNPLPLNEHWSKPLRIPPTWNLCTETAIIYPIEGGAKGIANIRGNFEVDNGIYVWVNGKFRFGARSSGVIATDGSFEYSNIDLGSLRPGLNFIQIIREDEGITNGYRVKITGTPL